MPTVSQVLLINNAPHLEKQTVQNICREVMRQYTDGLVVITIIMADRLSYWGTAWERVILVCVWNNGQTEHYLYHRFREDEPMRLRRADMIVEEV